MKTSIVDGLHPIAETQVLVTRELINTWNAAETDRPEPIGVWDTLDAAKDFLRSGVLKPYFDNKTATTVAGLSGTLLAWEVPGRSQEFRHQYRFYPIPHNAKPVAPRPTLRAVK